MTFDKEKILRLFIVSGIVLILDQASKIFVANTLSLHQGIPVIDGFFNITYVLNPGGAFGFLADQSEFIRKIVFLFWSSIALVVIYFSLSMHCLCKLSECIF